MKLPQATVINDEKFYGNVKRIKSQLENDNILTLSTENPATFLLLDDGVVLLSKKKPNKVLSYTILMVFFEFFDTIPSTTIRRKNKDCYVIAHGTKRNNSTKSS